MNSKPADKNFIALEDSMTSGGACFKYTTPESAHAYARKKRFDDKTGWAKVSF